jgi:hypothetical protein
MSDEEEADEIVDQVFEEIGLDLNEQVRLLRASSSALCKVPIDLYGYFSACQRTKQSCSVSGLGWAIESRGGRRRGSRRPVEAACHVAKKQPTKKRQKKKEKKRRKEKMCQFHVH